MANIKIALTYTVKDGVSLTFKAPCNCNAVSGIRVYYPDAYGEATYKDFTFKDAHGNSLTGMGELFITGAYVKTVLDTVNGFAFLQNADTNAYLEGRFDDMAEALEEHCTADGLTEHLEAGPMVLSSHQYGDVLPATGVPGQIFFLKV